MLRWSPPPDKYPGENVAGGSDSLTGLAADAEDKVKFSGLHAVISLWLDSNCLFSYDVF